MAWKKNVIVGQSQAERGHSLDYVITQKEEYKVEARA
jgi:hypothetical protein